MPAAAIATINLRNIVVPPSDVIGSDALFASALRRPTMMIWDSMADSQTAKEERSNHPFKLGVSFETPGTSNPALRNTHDFA